MDNIPNDYIKLPAIEVYTDGEYLVICGWPMKLDEEGHNCDAMGCGSLGPHVIAIGTYLYGDLLQRKNHDHLICLDN